jgi:hypothetical protein
LLGTNVRRKLDRIGPRLDLGYCDLAFLLRSQSILPTYAEFPNTYTISWDPFAAVGADDNWSE